VSENRLTIPNKALKSMRSLGDTLFDAKSLGLTFDQVMAPGALQRRQFDLPVDSVIRVHAVDGNAWVTLVGFTETGDVVLEQDRAPKRGPGRPPKGDE